MLSPEGERYLAELIDRCANGDEEAWRELEEFDRRGFPVRDYVNLRKEDQSD